MVGFLFGFPLKTFKGPILNQGAASILLRPHTTKRKPMLKCQKNNAQISHQRIYPIRALQTNKPTVQPPPPNRLLSCGVPFQPKKVLQKGDQPETPPPFALPSRCQRILQFKKPKGNPGTQAAEQNLKPPFKGNTHTHAKFRPFHPPPTTAFSTALGVTWTASSNRTGILSK